MTRIPVNPFEPVIKDGESDVIEAIAVTLYVEAGLVLAIFSVLAVIVGR